MSLVTWAKKNSRALAKIGLYGTGAVCLGWPLIAAGKRAYQGQSADNILWIIPWEGAGYDITTGKVVNTQLRNVIVRDVVGALAVLAARKI